MPKRLEILRASYADAEQRAQEAITAVLDLADDAPADVVDAAVIEKDEAVAESERFKGEIAKREALLAAREVHTPVPLDAAKPVIHSTARGQMTEEQVYRPTQRDGAGGNKGYFHDIALASSGDPHARERLERNNKHVQFRATGDTTATTEMGEFVPPDWTNELYASVLRAGRAFADQCINIGEPVSSVWNIPRITTGSSTAVQTEASAVSNTEHVSDNIIAILQTIGGYDLASYQLVDLAEPGMDGIVFADLVGSLNQQVDSSLLTSTTTSAQGAFGLTGINSVTYTQTTPTGAAFWPTVFQAKSLIEKNTFQGVDFAVLHPSTWNWFLSTLDTSNRPLALATTGAAFNAMAEYNPNAQGLAGNIGGIPVIVDANVTVTDGVGTNQAKVLLCNRSALLKKESAPKFKLSDQFAVTSLMYAFVAYTYLQRAFGRHPKKISAITGTGLVVQSGF